MSDATVFAYLVFTGVLVIVGLLLAELVWQYTEIGGKR